MKIKLDKKDFLAVLSRAQNIVERRNTMPVLINVLLETQKDGVRLFATNLEVSLTDKCKATVIEPGRAAVNAKSLFEIVKELPEGPITVEKQSNNWLKLSQGKAVFNIVGISPDEYPVFPTLEASEFFTMDCSVMADMIDKTIYSVSNDETRYHLNGVYLEKNGVGADSQIRMVATDGHRLSVVDRKSKGVEINIAEAGVIIPRKGLNEVRKLIETSTGPTIQMAIEGAQLVVKQEETLIMIRLIEGKYPNYKQLIPKNLSETATMSKDGLLHCLRRVSLLSNAKSKGVTFNLSAGRMEISSTNPELGDAKEELEITYKGPDLKIGFNAKYILDVLGTIEEDEIDFELKDQLSPGMLKPTTDGQYTCVIMPMRI